MVWVGLRVESLKEVSGTQGQKQKLKKTVQDYKCSEKD